MQVGKILLSNVRDAGLIPGSRRFSEGENGKPLKYSCLENSVNRGAWWVTILGVTKSQTPLSYWELFLCYKPGNKVHWYPQNSAPTPDFFIYQGLSGVLMGFKYKITDIYNMKSLYNSVELSHELVLGRVISMSSDLLDNCYGLNCAPPSIHMLTS